MEMRSTVFLLAAMMLALVAASGVAYAATVSNGGFEAGDLSGWTVKNQQGSSGDWFAYSGTTSPLGGSIAGPPRGSFAATTDQDDPGSHVLFKNITLQSNMRHKLSFFLYYDNHADAFYPRNTLDYTLEGRNQQYRIDVLKSKADPFTVNPDGFLELATALAPAADEPDEAAEAAAAELA